MSAPGGQVREIDIRGQVCPSCLLTVLREVNERRGDLDRAGACIRVVTDDRQATNTIPGSLAAMGYRTDVRKVAGHYRIEIRKAEPARET